MSKNNYLVIEARSDTASFRVPEYHNFHKTLPLPPPTTVAGIAGAALGLDFKSTQEYFINNEIYMGIFGKSSGFFSDLWKIRPIKSKKFVQRSIVKREFHFNNDYVLVFGGDESVMYEMRDAFHYPKFALTMGNSDSLLLIKNVSILIGKVLTSDVKFNHCVVKGSQKGTKTLEGMEAFKVYRYSTFQTPQVYNLPILFDFDNDQIRTIARRQEFSFIGNPVNLEKEQSCIEYNGNLIPLFKYGT